MADYIASQIDGETIYIWGDCHDLFIVQQAPGEQVTTAQVKTVQ